MNKKDITSMSKEELLIFIVRLEGFTIREANSSRGRVTNQSIKEYKWALEYAAKILDLDIEQLKKSSTFDYLWEK
ncbi:hypothetical protein CN918_28980 [Priestia megaterium]|nr:hypothetical protein CN918_28980 [Priestia megaterium]